jgi:hypothetical protein
MEQRYGGGRRVYRTENPKQLGDILLARGQIPLQRLRANGSLPQADTHRAQPGLEGAHRLAKRLNSAGCAICFI